MFGECKEVIQPSPIKGEAILYSFFENYILELYDVGGGVT